METPTNRGTELPLAMGRQVVEHPSRSVVHLCALSAVAIGVWPRLAQATGTYLNPDEAFFYFAGSADTVDGMLEGLGRSQHAPLFILILHLVEKISSSELALRFVPLVAGSLFPWVMFRWLEVAWNRLAGLIALVVLTFSPPLVSLSAQARGYTVVLLLASVSLFYLETGIVRRSAKRLVLSAACVSFALLTEYSAAFFAGGAALYFLFRHRDGIPRRLVAVWIVGQAVALAVCLGLYVTQAAALLANPQNAALMRAVFSGGYRGDNQPMMAFLASGTARQFSYAMGSHVLGALAMAAFAGGLWRLRIRGRHALVALLASPIIIAWGATMLSHPFGRSRHTAVLSLFVATGVAIGLESAVRRRAALVAIGGLAIVVNVTGWTDAGDIDPVRQHLASMQAAVQYLRERVPPNGVVFADAETSLLLKYYLRDDRQNPTARQRDPEVQFGDLHLVTAPNWDFGDTDRLATQTAWLRHLIGAEPGKPIWIADGGFTTNLRSSFRRRYPLQELPDERDFGGAVQVFRLPPGL